jgi:transcriptional regulator with XRE-family HTH domain
MLDAAQRSRHDARESIDRANVLEKTAGPPLGSSVSLLANVMTSRYDHDSRLGARFRALRRERGLSLTEVAKGTEISSSFLSLFENEKSDITFSRLARLVRFFDISITDLIPDPEPSESIVVRRELRRRLDSPDEGAELFLLTHDTRHRMAPVVVVAEPGGTPVETASMDGSELFVLVVRGAVEVESDGEPTIRLRKGDAAYFADERTRAFRTVGRHRSELVVVRSPPAL